jgi:hypothetical protein
MSNNFAIVLIVLIIASCKVSDRWVSACKETANKQITNGVQND